jgi:hypothetical protein
LWEAIDAQRREARRVLNDTDRQITELVAARLDQAEARLVALKARLRELLARGDDTALAEARALVAEA